MKSSKTKAADPALDSRSTNMAEPGLLGPQRSSFRPQAGTWQILPVTLASRAPRPLLPDPESWALLGGTQWSPPRSLPLSGPPDSKFLEQVRSQVE